MEWMSVGHGKLQHNIVLNVDGRSLHLIADGDNEYGHWLMTLDELSDEKAYNSSLANMEEWNKIAAYSLHKNTEYNKQPVIIYRLPWYNNDTCNHYRNNPSVVFVDHFPPRPFTWRDAISNRGSDEKITQFVDWYNNKVNN